MNGPGEGQKIQPCLQHCFEDLDLDDPDCSTGCAKLNECAEQCLPLCKGEMVTMSNCHLADALGGEGICSCAAEKASYVSSVESFALDLATVLKNNNNLRA